MAALLKFNGQIISSHGKPVGWPKLGGKHMTLGHGGDATSLRSSVDWFPEIPNIQEGKSCIVGVAM